MLFSFHQAISTERNGTAKRDAMVGTALDCKIHTKQPATCPPPSAQQVDQILYRGLKGVTACSDDFHSDAEKDRKGCDFSDCQSFGLSVWVNESGVETARLVVPGFKKKCIVSFAVKKNDGKLLHTPTNRQPEHHTFWRSKTLALPPAHDTFLERGSL